MDRGIALRAWPALAVGLAMVAATTAGCTLGAGQVSEQAGSGSLNLRGIRVIDAQTGWAVSDHFILRTSDGTASWENVSPRDEYVSPQGPLIPPITAWAARDGLHAWVIVDVEGRGVLYRTDDGGMTWTSAPAPLPVGRLVLGAEGQAWLAGPSARAGAVQLDWTQDGGNHWQELTNLSPARPVDLAGGPNAPLWLVAPPEVRVSPDGGRSWRRAAIPALSSGGRVQLLPLSGRQAVLVFAGYGGTQFYVTADAGRSWQKAGSLPHPAFACFLPDGRGWAAEQVPGQPQVTLLRTPDAGRRWMKVGSLEAAGLEQVQFADGSVGWLLAGGAVYTTDDGGRTWQQFPGRVMEE